VERFVRFRNEAAHDVPEEILSHDEVLKLQSLITAIGTALSEMVRSKVIERHIELGHTLTIGTVTEIHYKGSIIVLNFSKDVYLSTGDFLCISKNGVNRMAKVIALQDYNNDVQYIEGKVGQEVGLKLSIRSCIGSEVKTVVLPSKHVQLSLEVTQEVPAEVRKLFCVTMRSFQSLLIWKAASNDNPLLLSVPQHPPLGAGNDRLLRPALNSLKKCPVSQQKWRKWPMFGPKNAN